MERFKTFEETARKAVEIDKDKTCGGEKLLAQTREIITAINVVVPTFLDDGAEAFWKPMLDGVHSIVQKRGWSERVMMLGCGSDTRPSQKVGEAFRSWAPYARWDIYSHFSGDPDVGGANGFFYKGPPLPGSAPGKLIGVDNLDVGLQENPWADYGVWLRQLDFLAVTLQRGLFDDRSPDC